MANTSLAIFPEIGLNNYPTNRLVPRLHPPDLSLCFDYSTLQRNRLDVSAVGSG